MPDTGQQSLSGLVLICVDDGSTDSSPDIHREYAAKDSRLKVICQDNAGAGAARSRGLAPEKDCYLSFLVRG